MTSIEDLFTVRLRPLPTGPIGWISSRYLTDHTRRHKAEQSRTGAIETVVHPLPHDTTNQHRV
ncbi:hypothetical protein GCM10007170_46670 [Arthrobacter liuii]|uniref:Uncharacterized protein n=1 Tax=Arthrobacter liuii TaxID=1476996 RepID=A0ABQ2B3I6_9MICC|nr:hypothetical protein GCM10007170_46670 [Arthrobacter liuii]